MNLNKKLTANQKEICRLVTSRFRVSYPHVFKAQSAKPGDKKKFSLHMLFPKDEPMVGEGIRVIDGVRTVVPRSIEQAILNAKVATFGKDRDAWPEDLQDPISDGDLGKNAQREGYKGHWVIKATTAEDQRPSVVDRKGKLITEPSDFYPGCYARAYIYAYVWEYMGKVGVGFILDHVQKLGDGKSFGGKKPVDQVFGSLGDEEESESESEETESEESGSEESEESGEEISFK